MLKTILATLMICATVFFVAPASADTPNCISLSEFKAVTVSNGTIAQDGTHRETVFQIFDVRPGPGNTFNPEGPEYDLADFYEIRASCDNDTVYHMYYDRVEHSAGHVHLHLDVKCAVDGPGGTRDRCVRG